jgi:hypothetical protein
VEGRPVGKVAEQSTALVESTFAVQAETKRQTGAPPALRTRDNRIVVEPKVPLHPSTEYTPPEYRQQNDEGAPVETPQSDRPPRQGQPQLQTRPPQQQQPVQQQPPQQQQPSQQQQAVPQQSPAQQPQQQQPAQQPPQGNQPPE